MVAFQKTSSTVSWLWAEEPQAALTFRYNDVCIRDTKAVDIDTMSWEGPGIEIRKNVHCPPDK